MDAPRFGADRLSIEWKSALFGEKVIQNIEISVMFRFHKEADVFSPSFYLQYFDGTGLMLRDYDLHQTQWRIGLAIIPNAPLNMR